MAFQTDAFQNDAFQLGSGEDGIVRNVVRTIVISPVKTVFSDLLSLILYLFLGGKL